MKNEKIEIIEYNEDENIFINNLFNKINIVYILRSSNSERDILDIVTEDDNFPSMIGKAGINIKLANKILGKPTNLHRLTAFNLMLDELKSRYLEDEFLADDKIDKDEVGSFLAHQLESLNYNTYRDLLSLPIHEIQDVQGMNMDILYKILSKVK